jgi:tetratricopeptide (TPR) repeat protein
MTSIDDTLRELEEHLKASPNDASAWNAKGVLLARKEQFGEALRCLDQATRLDPSHAEAFVNRGRVLLALGPSKAGDALRSFDRALELTPQSPTTLWDRALALRVLGRLKDEMACLQTIIQLASANAMIWSRTGDIQMELGQAEQAIERYDQALSLDAKFVPALVGRALALSRLENWSGALESAESAAKLAPQDIGVWRVLADVNMRAEKYRSATKALKKALEIDPSDPFAENAMGMVAYKEGRLHDAVKHFRGAIVRKRDHVSALRNLGFVYMELEEWEEASRTWSTLTTLVKDDPNVYDAQAVAHARLDDFCSAADAWEEARRLYKKVGNEKEAERVHELGRVAKINCGRQKDALRAQKEREKAQREFSHRFEMHRRKQQG